MTRIRWRLLTAMVTVVVVTIALSGVFTRRVTHDELRIAKRAASNAGRDVIVVDGAGRIVSASPALHGALIRINGDKIEISSNRDGHLMQLVLYMQPTPIPGTTNRVYFVPRERPDQLQSLDRRLIVMFVLAILVAVIFTFLISRHITRPIEQLTSAVQDMARGKTRTNVPVRGRDEIARLATSFNAMSDAIANQQELRKRMVADAAHELRTPITNLRCELESVQDGLATPNIASLYEEVLHLQRLVDDLQELAIADAGGTKLQLVPLDLVGAIEQIVKEPVDAQARPIVRADPVRLAQIMRNLLANAARYAPVRVVVRSENGDAIVSVIDSGPGIPPGELENIFERFYRLDESRTQKGAGLGLAIVRRLVELHGGRVWAENAPGGGAAFTFTIAM
ncbi:MAG TPA: ATP-binding protein [Thermoanaerobaculia bacterium]|nr:ATP-binding protein [Thermoanaerobaculia bacterium]